MGNTLLEKLYECDPVIYAPVTTDLSYGDRRSFLAILAALRDLRTPYAYLEIGSAQGGSLQPLLIEPLCEKIYSIDSRPVEQPPDERDYADWKWQSWTTQDMLDNLRPLHRLALSKLETFDSDSRHLDPTLIRQPPRLCFIDAEHTDAAAFDDFRFCLSVASPDALFLFHDVQIVFRGIAKCIKHLKQSEIAFRFYLLPGNLALIEMGSLSIIQHPKILECLTQSGVHTLEALGRLGTYRDEYYKEHPKETR